jgi:hypothetical protein
MERSFTESEIGKAIMQCPMHMVEIKTPPMIDGMLEQTIGTIEPSMFLMRLLKGNYTKEKVEAIMNPEPPLFFTVQWNSAMSNPPKENGRYWCNVADQNDLGLSYYQWNCNYNLENNTWTEAFKQIRVTHWTELLPRPLGL